MSILGDTLDIIMKLLVPDPKFRLSDLAEIFTMPLFLSYERLISGQVLNRNLGHSKTVPTKWIVNLLRWDWRVTWVINVMRIFSP